MVRSVTITGNGREGRVQYSDGVYAIDGYWELGGNDVVTIVQMGSREEWRRAHGWAVDQRAAILRFVADEVVRQRAPSCEASIDEERGELLLRQRVAGAGRKGGMPSEVTSQAKAVAFVRRYSKLKAMLGLGVLVLVLIVGGALWMGKKVLSVTATHGVPFGECVRTETHIASLIQTTDPHLPEISGRGGNTTTSLSIVLIPLNGSDPQVVPVVSGLSGGAYSLARIMGSDGRTLWFDCTGLFGVRLSDHELVTTKDLHKANASLEPSWWEDPRGMDIVDGKLRITRIDRSAALVVDPATWKATPTEPKPHNARFDRHDPTDHLAAGFIAGPGTWLGLHSPTELEGAYKPGKWVRPVESADDAKQMRRLCKADLEPSTDGEHFRIEACAPISTNEYLNAAFLRMHDKSEPLRLKDPDGALMMYTSAPGLVGTLVVARLDAEGKVLWSQDTGLDRFKLQQILPGEDAFAFVGTRPPVEGELSEPLVVVVDNASGMLRSHTLWW